MLSLPVWGEWIEIATVWTDVFSHGSLPVWGEWIEIGAAWNDRRIINASLPVWGEWIEMLGSPS